MESDSVVEKMLDDAGWIFDTYHEDEDEDDKTSAAAHVNYIRKRLRAIAARHRVAAELLRGYRNAT